jgi:hypothetical protein
MINPHLIRGSIKDNFSTVRVTIEQLVENLSMELDAPMGFEKR